MSEQKTQGASFEELCAALRGRLRSSGFCKEAADAIMTAARSSVDWTTAEPPYLVPPMALSALQAPRSTWSRRCADAREVIVRLEANIHHMNYGFGPPLGVKAARPDWLRPIDGGKSSPRGGNNDE